MNFTAIENALRAWVLTASNLDEQHVIWSNQDGNRPSGDVITLKLGDGIPLGAFDAIEEKTDLARPAGQEVELQVQGPREMVLAIQCFTDSDSGDATARAVLSTVQTKARLPSIAAALEAAGVSIFDLGRVQYVPAINGTDFEGRAVLEVRLYVVDTASEFTSYVSTVEVHGEGISSVPFTFEVTS